MNIKQILADHLEWLKNGTGNRANLRGANLSGTDLIGANLSGTDLIGANLSGTDLRGANLSWTNLSGANLSGANLSGANLSGANLSGTNLSGANLRGAKGIPSIAAAQTLIVPTHGTVTGWKKCQDGVIVKLRIPATAKRHNATGRKCRAERAVVLAVFGADVGLSVHDGGLTMYVKGKAVVAPNYDPDRWNECGGGIHFYITREEAEAH